MLSDLLKYHHVEIDASKTLSSLTGFSSNSPWLPGNVFKNS